jgi:hypothetical protein
MLDHPSSTTSYVNQREEEEKWGEVRHMLNPLLHLIWLKGGIKCMSNLSLHPNLYERGIGVKTHGKLPHYNLFWMRRDDRYMPDPSLHLNLIERGEG